MSKKEHACKSCNIEFIPLDKIYCDDCVEEWNNMRTYKEYKKEKKKLAKNNKTPDYMDKTPEKEEFNYYVKKCGGSSHIMLGKRWLGRFVNVTVEEVKE
jgi:hypothetical protein